MIRYVLILVFIKKRKNLKTISASLFQKYEFFCRGIRIKDAESRQKVKEILAAEEAMKEMMPDVDDEPKQPVAKKVKEVKMAAKKSGSKKLLKKKGKSKLGIDTGAMKVD